MIIGDDETIGTPDSTEESGEDEVDIALLERQFADVINDQASLSEDEEEEEDIASQQDEVLPSFSEDEVFVHLNVHSDYSQIDSTIRIKDLVQNARKRGIAALALTDQMNICGAIKFYTSCLDFGIKPIIGAQLLVNDRKGHIRRVSALAQNPVGYYQICELITQAYRNRPQGEQPLVNIEWFNQYHEGFALLFDLESYEYRNEISADNIENINLFIKELYGLFKDNTYLEIHRIDDANSQQIHKTIIELSSLHGISIIATNATRFINKEDYQINQIRMAISDGLGIGTDRRPQPYFESQYLKSGTEMRQLFADSPQIIENTLNLARKCTTELHLGEHYLPDFPIPQGYNEAEYLKKIAFDGLEQRLSQTTHPINEPHNYKDRLESELAVIDRMGFNGYFLIVADFIQWAKQHNIPVGPGRGSGAGSIAAWVLQITDIDPIRYGLLFERFLNPERVSMPDFDIDFCQERREEVIQYVTQKYGEENVGQIITFGTLAAKNSIRDVGRVLGYGYNQCDAIARLVPPTPGISLDEAIAQTPELRELVETDEDAGIIFSNARRVEGLTRNFGTHAAGVVIGPKPLSHYTAVYSESKEHPPVVQYNMKDIESAGLVKFDFLGLTTLTIIDKAVQNANEWRKKEGIEPLDIARLEPNDAKVYKALSDGDTHSVFQMESSTATELSIQLKPDVFEEIIDMMAINRPGPLGSEMDKMYINVKHQREEPQYLHPLLEPILAETKGVILYQEQVMEICRQMAGYSLGQADLMRRAMGKKIAAEMQAQADTFIKGAEEQGVEPNIARAIFNQIEKFANYGFNKSHSAAYAVLAYQTAYLKVYYRAAFYVANMNLALNNTTRIVSLIGQAKKYNIDVLPPDINHSVGDFIAVDKKSIRYGLCAIKGVGEGIVEKIVEARTRIGEFANLYDFFTKIGSKLLNKRVFEALVKGGAFDALNANRAECIAQYQQVVAWVAQEEKLKESGQVDLFSMDEGDSHSTKAPQLTTHKPWQILENIAFEREVLGLYLDITPLDVWRNEIDMHSTCALHQIDDIADYSEQISAGIYVSHRVQYTKSGDKLVFILLRDGVAENEILLRAHEAEALGDALKPDNVFIFRFYNYQIKNSEFKRRKITGIFSIRELISMCGSSVEIRVSLEEQTDITGFVEYLNSQSKGNVLMNFYVFDSHKNRLTLKGEKSHAYQINSDDILEYRRLLGVNNVKTRYYIPWPQQTEKPRKQSS